MARATRRLLSIGILLMGTGCSGATSPGAEGATAGPRPRANQITFEEMQRRGQHSNLYVLVQDLRPRWLRSQGPDRFIGPQGQVQVHMDGNRLGGVDVLRRLSAYGVTSIEWVAPIDAGARFGLNHGHGAIVVSTAVIH